LLTHYSTIALKNGPLSQFSTMRFEAKHNYFKKSLTVSSNFLNIPQSLAIKSQIHFANILLNYDFEADIMEKYGEKLVEEGKSYEKLKKFGRILKKGVVFEVFEEEIHETKLLKVEKIIEKNCKLIAICRTLENPHISNHFDCYSFEQESDDLIEIDLDTSQINFLRFSHIYNSKNGKFVNLSK
jgi:hypothetical protein